MNRIAPAITAPDPETASAALPSAGLPRRSLLAGLPAGWPFGAGRSTLLAALTGLSAIPCPDPVLGTQALLAAPGMLATHPALAGCRSFAASWFARKDSSLWRGLAETIADLPAAADAIELLELCRWVRAHRPLDLLTVRQYAALWPAASKAKLRASLNAMGLAESCRYLASYRPRGIVPALPFALAAETLIDLRLQQHGRWQQRGQP